MGVSISIAPGHSPSQAALPPRQVGGAVGQQVEAATQLLQDYWRRQHVCAESRQFYGKRQAIKPLGYLGHRAYVRRCKREVVLHGSRTLHEEGYSLEVGQPVYLARRNQSFCHTSVGNEHRWHANEVLSVDV